MSDRLSLRLLFVSVTMLVMLCATMGVSTASPLSAFTTPTTLPLLLDPTVPLVTIDDAVWDTQALVMLSNPPGTITDLLLFFNDNSNRATIFFVSEDFDSSGAIPPLSQSIIDAANSILGLEVLENTAGTRFVNGGNALEFTIAPGESITLQAQPQGPTPIPEPSTVLLLGMGILGLIIARRWQ